MLTGNPRTLFKNGALEFEDQENSSIGEHLNNTIEESWKRGNAQLEDAANQVPTLKKDVERYTENSHAEANYNLMVPNTGTVTSEDVKQLVQADVGALTKTSKRTRQRRNPINISGAPSGPIRTFMPNPAFTSAVPGSMPGMSGMPAPRGMQVRPPTQWLSPNSVAISNVPGSISRMPPNPLVQMPYANPIFPGTPYINPPYIKPPGMPIPPINSPTIPMYPTNGHLPIRPPNTPKANASPFLACSYPILALTSLLIVGSL